MDLQRFGDSVHTSSFIQDLCDMFLDVLSKDKFALLIKNNLRSCFKICSLLRRKYMIVQQNSNWILGYVSNNL